MRKLASIQKIMDLKPIEGADRIETATVLGWRVVVKKGEFTVGDSCVFFEIDSILPHANPAFGFLGDKKRLKTIRLRGQLSQGLALTLPMVFEHTGTPDDVAEGVDVTEFLNVQKYNPAENKPFRGAKGETKGSFPSFLPKTDEQRVQSVPRVLEEMIRVPIFATVKLDGTSFTAYKYNGEFGVCSRNNAVNYEMAINLYAEAAEKYDLENVLPDGYAIQAELVGPRIQGNKLALDERRLYVFNVYNIEERRFLSYDDFTAFCVKIGMQTVPIVFANAVRNTLITIDILLGEATGKYAQSHSYPEFSQSSWEREGIVIRPMNEMYSEALSGRFSFKVVNNDFLERGGD